MEETTAGSLCRTSSVTGALAARYDLSTVAADIERGGWRRVRAMRPGRGNFRSADRSGRRLRYSSQTTYCMMQARWLNGCRRASGGRALSSVTHRTEGAPRRQTAQCEASCEVGAFAAAVSTKWRQHITTRTLLSTSAQHAWRLWRSYLVTPPTTT
jgi:hypothetical protein